jgi:N-methylhydantoinase A
MALCEGDLPVDGIDGHGLPSLPVIDIHTVGPGGGSIAYLDAAGAPRRPQSGADPGPCYGPR